MKETNEVIIELFSILERIYATYLDVYFIEIDKGTSLFYNDFEMFKKLNNRNKQNLKVIESLLARKNTLVNKLKKENNYSENLHLNDIIEKYYPHLIEDLNYWKKKFYKLIESTSDINSKNIILLNTSTQVMREIYNSISKEKTEKYNKTGKLKHDFDIIRFHAQV